MTWADLIAKPKDARPWLVTGLVRPGWLVALLGHGKEGKTTLALHLLACLAEGSPWVNRSIPQALPTIYLGFGMAEEDLVGLVEPIQRGRTFQCLP
jgi:RecA-family ATPase